MTTDQTTTTDHEPETVLPAPVWQPAYDAIYTLIRALGDHIPASPVHRNALIWRAIETALDAMDESGRLLPSGGEVSTQWAVLNVHSEFASTICSERVAAERTAAAFHGEGDYVASRTVTTWGEGHGQTKLVGRWAAVLSDNSEATR